MHPGFLERPMVRGPVCHAALASRRADEIADQTITGGGQTWRHRETGPMGHDGVVADHPPVALAEGHCETGQRDRYRSGGKWRTVPFLALSPSSLGEPCNL